MTLLTHTTNSGPQVYRGPSGLWQTEAPHITEDSTPLSIFMVLFFEIIQLLVEETNRYYHLYLDTLDEGQSPLPEVTVQEMHLFLAITVWTGHDQKDTLKDYW